MARELAAVELERMADEAPISGNEVAKARVLLAADRLRAMLSAAAKGKV